jgi:hypothetical protein
MCGNRLKTGDTMPMASDGVDIAPTAVTSRPSITILPASIGSRRSMHRKGRLARTARSDQAHDLVVLHDEVDPGEHLELVEALVESFDAERFRHGPSPLADDADRVRSANRRTASRQRKDEVDEGRRDVRVKFPSLA